MRLIDADKIIFREIDEIGGEYEPYLGCSKSQIDNLPTVEAVPVTEKAFEMFEADYEARLKTDMVSMLEVIKLRIDNLPEPLNRDRVNYCVQEKINELKAESED